MESDKYFNSDLGKIYYAINGKGPPIVLLHATPRSSNSFRELSSYLSERYQVISIDTLGFGKSDDIPRGISIPLLAKEKIKLLKSLKLKDITIFGLHTGNKIATEISQSAPSLIKNLIVCGMTHSIIIDKDKRSRAIKELIESDALSKIKMTHEEILERKRGAKSMEIIYEANYNYDLALNVSKVLSNTLILELLIPEEAHFGNQSKDLSKMCINGSFKTLYGSDRYFLEQDYITLGNNITQYIEKNKN